MEVTLYCLLKWKEIGQYNQMKIMATKQKSSSKGKFTSKVPHLSIVKHLGPKPFRFAEFRSPLDRNYLLNL